MPICIAGLGNPWIQYQHNRHNAGFLAVDFLAQQRNFPAFTNTPKRHTHLTQGQLQTKIIIAKPQSYMNRSGQPIQHIISYYNITPNQLLVIHDEIDLPMGTVKHKENGWHAGHNGLRDIIQHLGSKDFPRIRIGVGRPDTPQSVSDYVLSNFTPPQREQFDTLLPLILQKVTTWVQQVS